MENKDIKITNLPNEIDVKNVNIKYPFSGIAPNLIDKFLVLGYEPKVIENTFQRCNIEPKGDLQTRFQFYEFEERPYIVNEICNDYTKDLLDNDLILELIYPNFPQMYFMEKQYINTKKEADEELLISSYSIIFSINPQDNSGSKKSYNGLGYVFFNTQEHRNIMGELDGFLYIPIAYVILSEYPYFYHFNEICKNIFNQMKKENDEIPIEVLIYNTVKFAPSPINKSINLSFGAQIGFRQDNNNKIENILASLNSISAKDYNGIPSMFFNQLSGYPFMDINLSFIFNLIPPEIIVEVFIFSFLEHDIIFYSSRPEILNMVMYIFSSLNYPFNDSIYYWHILSVSQESFMSGTSTFVGKTCSTITGILTEYDPEILTTKKIREHFVLDIDNKNFFFLYQDETDDVKDTMDLYNYIKSCAEDVEDSGSELKKDDRERKLKTCFNDGIQLYEVIKNLMEELIRRAKKVTSTNYNEKEIKPTFLTMYEDESEMECMKSNMRLQKAFFTFITQVIQNFLSILSIGEEDKGDNDSYGENRIPSIVVNINKEEINQEDESKRIIAKNAGRIFKEKFQECSKYSSFVVSFCKFHETTDLYKIPYTFINEFIYYSHVAVRNNLSEVDVFKLIDQFYGKIKMLGFEEIISEKEDKKKDKEEKKKKEKSRKKEKSKKKINIKGDFDNPNHIDILSNSIEDNDIENIYLFSFDNFAEFYQKKLRAYINREQEDDREIFTKVKASNRNYKKYKRNCYFLSNKILNIYISFTINNFEELISKFKLIKCEYENLKNKESKIIGESDFSEIDKNISNSAPVASNNIKLIMDTNQNDNIIFQNKLINNKNKYIDYFYYLLHKSLDKSERDLLFFGKYEFMEITDVIERHFILERCFSSYGLIKFSLLNVLAVTRTMESKYISNKNVIKTMCDFCEKTKSLVRKYMNIYLNIFNTLSNNKNLKETFEYDECLNIITLYFKKTNMIPTEETAKAFNEIKESESKSVISNRSSIASNISQKDDDNFYNYVNEHGKFFEIKEGIFHKNTREKFEEILKTIETIFSGKYKNSAISFNYKELDDLYDEIKTDKKDKFYPKTPMSLYSNTNKILMDYLKNFSIKENIYNELCKDILSLLYYFKIPIIEGKWIEQYKEKIQKVSPAKNPKNAKKGKEPVKSENVVENNDIKKLNKILKKIIAILVDLFNVVKNYRKINNK